MLSVEAQDLWEEARASIEWHQKRTAATKQMIEAYQTPWHKGFAEGDKFGTLTNFDSRNHAFEYIALTIAQTVFDNPRWQVSAKRGYAAEVDAPALQSGLNRWTEDVRLRKKLVRHYVDYCFSSCTNLLSRKRVPMERARKSPELWRPYPTRIGITRAFRDHRSFDPEDCRFKGHLFAIDREDAMEDPEWIRAAVEAVPEESGMREFRGNQTNNPKMNRPRGEIACMSIWVPEYELPDDDPFWKNVPDNERDDYHGTLFVLPYEGPHSSGRKGENEVRFLQDPRPFYGPSRGPYQHGGSYPVPDDILDLSSLVAVEGQNRQNNSVARALYNAIVDYKKIILTSHRKPTLAALVKRSRHGSVLSADLQDLSRMLAQVELGGPTPALLQSAQVTQETLDRSSGISDAMRGNVTGQATAFENSVAAAGATARQAFPKQQFVDFIGEIGWSAAWYMHADDQFQIDIDGGSGIMLGGPPSAHAEAIRSKLVEAGLPEKTIDAYIEYAQKQYDSTPFEGFEFKIEPLSTERAGDPANRARLGALIPMALQIGQAQAQMPWLNCRDMLGWLGQAFDVPDLAKILDQQQAIQAGMQMQQAQLQQSQGGGEGGQVGGATPSPSSAIGTGQPRLGGDIGGTPQPVGAKQMPYRGNTGKSQTKTGANARPKNVVKTGSVGGS